MTKNKFGMKKKCPRASELDDVWKVAGLALCLSCAAVFGWFTLVVFVVIKAFGCMP